MKRVMLRDPTTRLGVLQLVEFGIDEYDIGEVVGTHTRSEKARDTSYGVNKLSALAIIIHTYHRILRRFPVSLLYVVGQDIVDDLQLYSGV